ncbi:hypothetical protein ABIQ69_04105 [Agromyces sp. G08B096]|uniref:Uncharacterized protein n=1 Tax=Agromyces sp. G08B096 TaxID=3156399 RepID=A0AAU7W9H2_9MICO
MTQDPPASGVPIGRRPVFWLVVAAAVVLLAVVVVGIVIGPGRGGPSADAGASAPPTGSAADDATAAPATDAPASTPPSGTALPSDCAEIYTKDWSGEFAPLVLNPAWTLEPESGVHRGSRDADAVALLDSTVVLECAWGHPNGGSDRGLTTNLARVTPEQAGAMSGAFAAAGYSCYEELGGTRCVTETPPSPDGQAGESHFFRDDVWIATLWVNTGPDGYTHDIVTAIFG